MSARSRPRTSAIFPQVFLGERTRLACWFRRLAETILSGRTASSRGRGACAPQKIRKPQPVLPSDNGWHTLENRGKDSRPIGARLHHGRAQRDARFLLRRRTVFLDG